MSNPVFYIIGGIMEQVHRVVLSHLDYDGQGKILEVGCGSGALTIRAALTWPKAKVIGIDYAVSCVFFFLVCQHIGTLSILLFKDNIKFILCHIVIPPS